MQTIRVTAAALNQIPLDWSGNRDRIRRAIAGAREEGASILCLPELCLTGYGCEDAFLSAGLRRRALNLLEELLPVTNGMLVTLGLPLLYRNALYNTVALAGDGKLLGFVAKRYLAGDGIHYEPRWFKPWPAGLQKSICLGDREVPLGDLDFDVDGVRIGFEICEDAWVAQRPGAAAALRGADIILNPSASHFAFGKRDVRERFVMEGSRAYNVSYVYSNLVGNESGRAIYDGETLIASAGRLLKRGPRFSFRDVVLTTAEIDLDHTRTSQVRTHSYQPQMDEDQPDPVRASFPWKFGDSVEAAEEKSPDWKNGSHVKEEEFARAVGLALFDYLRKSHSRGFVVSLSGGADSSAVACLVAGAIQLAWKELGMEGVRKRLPFLPQGIDSPQAAMPHLLTCAYQASENSSETTLNAARVLAEALNAKFLNFDISALVEGYVRMVEDGLGRELSWETDDIALQNIQARVRAPGVWMVANLKGALLLSTSNRSEAAVGYATMDGDTCGGLSPIAGIDKAFLRTWLTWAETNGPEGLGPVPALAAVNQLQPTAELRPQAAGQTDEDDLMPYPVLDWIERAAIRDKQMPLEIYKQMEGEFPQFPAGDRLRWVERFFTLWSRNQWKRERYAPSFHLDDENLDPKTWCRFPILSGGFEVELAELRIFVDEQQS